MRAFVAVLLIVASAQGADWPQFLGPDRNGVSSEKLADLADPPVWKKELGEGWSSPVVANQKLVIFHRENDKEVIDCLAARTGKPIWRADYPTRYVDDFHFDNGPRATPAIVDNRVYTFGVEGVLSCWNLADGAKIWQIDTKDALKADKGYFGMACSPLVEGDAVIVNVRGIAAFDRSSGKLLWNTTRHEAGYSSPVAATINNKRYIFALTRAGLVGLDTAGKQLFDLPFRARSDASVNAASPVVIDDRIFLTASYGVGGLMLAFNDGNPKELWRGEELSSHYATPVYRDGYLYGFDGRQEQGPRLVCIDAKDGRLKWAEESFGAGTLMFAGGELLILHEKGELIRAAATPDGFKMNSRTKILDGDVRAYAALCDGLYFARDKSKLVCVDLRKK
jgi:outer membrane protein assembly factor BamB